MMKEIVKAMLLLMLSVISIQCSGTKSAYNILSSNDISEIQNYLDRAHPDDPKNSLLKKRIIELKNNAWTKRSADSRSIEARPVMIQKSFIEDVDSDKFEKLLQSDKINHKDKTVDFLNEMFNNNRDSPNAILFVKNHSHCNTILHIKEGVEEHDLAVPHDGENFIVLEKGKYTISGRICGAKYEKIKNLDHGIYITLKL
ncbi:hypothetical protein J2795_002107 [Chryseobacterium bernardetii]|uniref:Uncharacterized protein n=1 Tax=Chryseobacterium bernardetii TaxID=1241978 RepID=A0ACC6IUT7_9FLAO|nr:MULTISPECIES: DUF6759 domain-containing protein [Chryseobacterium]MDR6370847.1 hypothetical protein [Chryseobacterium vietnamense]MDR6441407.1 hypothetical protein [Chryseobacterium bernardetii]